MALTQLDRIADHCYRSLRRVRGFVLSEQQRHCLRSTESTDLCPSSSEAV